jgi:saccharopine dehydrogenase (NAD+, L-lysine-forming)
MIGLKLAPERTLRPLGKLMWWAMRQSKPPYEVMIAVQARGQRQGRPHQLRASVSHPDGYELTAIPVVAFLKQYLDGSARIPGLHMMGQLADPMRLLQDMERMGARVSCRAEADA